MYVEKVTIAGRVIYIDRYYSRRYEKGERRCKKRNSTPEAQAVVNKRKMDRECAVLINANFGYGDTYATLTYKKKPEDIDQVKKDRLLFLRRIRRECKKANITLKYIGCTEVGKRGALHHHVIMSGPDTKMVQECWSEGWVDIKPLDDTGQYDRLANYIAKYRQQWKESGGKGHSWSPSRNLVRPEPDRKIVNRKKFREDPRGRKGCYVEQDSIRRGIHEVTGYEFLSYRLIKERVP